LGRFETELSSCGSARWELGEKPPRVNFWVFMIRE